MEQFPCKSELKVGGLKVLLLESVHTKDERGRGREGEGELDVKLAQLEVSIGEQIR